MRVFTAATDDGRHPRAAPRNWVRVLGLGCAILPLGRGCAYAFSGQSEEIDGTIEEGAHQMGVDENKALVRRFVEAQNRGDLEDMLACWAPDAVNHAGRLDGGSPPASMAPSLQGLRHVFESLHTAFPDRHSEITDLIGEGDRVVCRMTVSGTHQGVPEAPVEGGRRLQRIAPSGRAYRV